MMVFQLMIHIIMMTLILIFNAKESKLGNSNVDASEEVTSSPLPIYTSSLHLSYKPVSQEDQDQMILSLLE